MWNVELDTRTGIADTVDTVTVPRLVFVLSQGQYTHFTTASRKIYLFVVYLTTLQVAQIAGPDSGLEGFVS
jgi:hypothetical protein